MAHQLMCISGYRSIKLRLWVVSAVHSRLKTTDAVAGQASLQLLLSIDSIVKDRVRVDIGMTG